MTTATRDREAGRGRGYSRLRRLGDDLLARLPQWLGPGRWMHAMGGQRRLRTVRYRQAVPGLAEPLRVAFASDLHCGPMTHPALVEAAFAALAAERPHLLLLGGDLVSGRAAWAAPAVRLAADFPAPLGRFAVLGNHDLWSDFERLEAALERAGVRLLTNAAHRLPAPWDAVTLYGLDDHGSGRPDATGLASAPGFRLVVMHSPASLADLAGTPFDLALCGHTHGGQIALPGGRPILVPGGRAARRFPHGVHPPAATGGGTLLVSRGVGFSMLPVRLFAPSEVAAVELEPG